MTHDEASALAKRIINTWHGGPALAEWVDALQTLNAGTAGTAFVRLRDNNETPPSIARFKATCRAIHPDHDPTPTRWTDPGIARDDPRAIGAFERGYRQGQHELWLISGGALGEERKGIA
jgi:hypothetical protein